MDIRRHNTHVDALFAGIEDQTEGECLSIFIPMNSLTHLVWMSHSDKLTRLPEGFVTIGETKNSPFAAIAHETNKVFGK